MSLRALDVGDTIARRYYTVPEGYFSSAVFDDWDDVLRHAQARRALLLAALTESLGGWAGPEALAEMADVQVVIELRWWVDRPDGGGMDVVVETYRQVDQLKFTPAAAHRS